jgi:hypothetical protein
MRGVCGYLNKLRQSPFSVEELAVDLARKPFVCLCERV